MKLIKYVAAALLAVTAANSTAALAQGPEAGGQAPDPVEIYKQAGINEEQEGEIRRTAKAFDEQQRVRLKTLFGLIRTMGDLQLQASPDDSEVLAKQDEINKLSNEMANERIKLLLKIRKILKPDQREKLVQMLKDANEKAAARQKAAPTEVDRPARTTTSP